MAFSNFVLAPLGAKWHRQTEILMNVATDRLNRPGRWFSEYASLTLSFLIKGGKGIVTNKQTN